MYSTIGSLLRLFGVDSEWLCSSAQAGGWQVCSELGLGCVGLMPTHWLSNFFDFVVLSHGLAGALAVALGLGALFIKAVVLVLNPLLPYQVVGCGL